MKKIIVLITTLMIVYNSYAVSVWEGMCGPDGTVCNTEKLSGSKPEDGYFCHTCVKEIYPEVALSDWKCPDNYSCCWVKHPSGTGATVVCDYGKVTMPTVESMRGFTRYTFDLMRYERERDGVVSSINRYNDLSFAKRELNKLGHPEVYEQEERRDALINHGYNPPENIEEY